jgi:hypothetical protein
MGPPDQGNPLPPHRAQVRSFSSACNLHSRFGLSACVRSIGTSIGSFLSYPSKSCWPRRKHCKPKRGESNSQTVRDRPTQVDHSHALDRDATVPASCQCFVSFLFLPALSLAQESFSPARISTAFCLYQKLIWVKGEFSSAIHALYRRLGVYGPA